MVTMPKRAICDSCTRPCQACLCHAFPSSLIETSTHLLIVQTAAEARCKVGTAWLLPRVLSNCKVVPPKQLAHMIPKDSVVLFPEVGSAPVEGLSSPPKCLILIDGTWESARRLLTNSSALQNVPRVHLAPLSSTSLFRVRRPPSDVAGARSTAEAAADGVEALEGELGSIAARAVRHAVHEASEMQLRFMRRKGLDNVPHRTERRGYVPGLYETDEIALTTEASDYSTKKKPT